MNSPAVHPRVCGEHVDSTALFPRPDGSSPRVRGTRRRQKRLASARRFIPACAGNTFCTRHLERERTVHPRVCGEHSWKGRRRFRDDGSSPRVRGTPLRSPYRAAIRRFIPACAGNTSAGGCQRNRSAVHPRVCGEHIGALILFAWTGGSSPRVRGTRQMGCRLIRKGRFIPACAGNTASTLTAARNMSVHPRVCGEHVMSRSTSDS